MSVKQNFQEQKKVIFEYLKAKLPDTNEITLAEIATHFTSEIAIICVDTWLETFRYQRETSRPQRRSYSREEMKSESEKED